MGSTQSTWGEKLRLSLRQNVRRKREFEETRRVGSFQRRGNDGENYRRQKDGRVVLDVYSNRDGVFIDDVIVVVDAASFVSREHAHALTHRLSRSQSTNGRSADCHPITTHPGTHGTDTILHRDHHH